MKFITIDIQGLYYDKILKQIIPKEITIYGDDRICEHFVIYPPKSYHNLTLDERRQVLYLESHHHRISYDAGAAQLCFVNRDIEKIVKKLQVDVIYVSGHQKYNYIHNLLKDSLPKVAIVNMENKVPPFKKTRPRCLYHNAEFCICSKTNAEYLYSCLKSC